MFINDFCVGVDVVCWNVDGFGWNIGFVEVNGFCVSFVVEENVLLVGYFVFFGEFFYLVDDCWMVDDWVVYYFDCGIFFELGDLFVFWCFRDVGCYGNVNGEVVVWVDVEGWDFCIFEFDFFLDGGDEVDVCIGFVKFLGGFNESINSYFVVEGYVDEFVFFEFFKFVVLGDYGFYFDIYFFGFFLFLVLMLMKIWF